MNPSSARTFIHMWFFAGIFPYVIGLNLAKYEQVQGLENKDCD